jgi:DNA-binding GntR family transcriptional regulator
VLSQSKRQRLPIRKRVYEDLKNAILSGRFDPQERLTEERLAETLGASRTPIREALYKLESEGLIRALDTRGFVVGGDSEEEIAELFELRAVLEGFALRLCAEKVGEEELRELGGYVESAEEALRDGRMSDVFMWNTQFHDALHRLVEDRTRLNRMIVEMRQQVLRHRKETLQTGEGARRTLEGHWRIILALKLRDPDLCEKTMRDHVMLSKADALRALAMPKDQKEVG